MEPEPFTIDIDQHSLDDLTRRLRDVRWAPEVDNDDWRYGTSGSYLREFVRYWLEEYDWRAAEKAMNAFDHYRVPIDGVPVHFMRIPGRGPSPKPLLLTHGWPWTFWDFRQVVGPLSDPGSYGGDPADAFEVIVPSPPGYAFSTPVDRSGLHWCSTADRWATLMRDVLGFDRFAAAGSDWGALVTIQLGHKYPDRVLGIHTTQAFPLPVFEGDRPWAMGSATDAVEGSSEPWERKFVSHVAVHMLDPQTLAFALHDSPVGLASWLLERRRAWADCHGDVERRFSKDDLITSVMIYWLTESLASSIRWYADAPNAGWTPAHEGLPAVTVPTGFSFFEPDLPLLPEPWLREYYNVRQIRSYTEGGHFGYAEVPDTMIRDVRDTFRDLA